MTAPDDAPVTGRPAPDATRAVRVALFVLVAGASIRLVSELFLLVMPS